MFSSVFVFFSIFRKFTLDPPLMQWGHWRVGRWNILCDVAVIAIMDCLIRGYGGIVDKSGFFPIFTIGMVWIVVSVHSYGKSLVNIVVEGGWVDVR